MRYVAQGPDHNGNWWVLDKNKGRYGAVVKAGMTEADARDMARKLNAP